VDLGVDGRIKLSIREIGLEGVGWMYLVHGTDL
jgi:hypothetical protein